jgi:hypothetical protein
MAFSLVSSRLSGRCLFKGGLQPLARPVSETASSGTAPADGVSGGSVAAPRPGKDADGRHHGARRAEARDPTGADHGPMLNPFCQRRRRLGAVTRPREPGPAAGAGTARGGAANEPWKERSFQGRFAAPPRAGPAAVFWAGGAPRGGVPTRPTRLRGSTTAGRDPESGDRSRLLDRLHQQSLLSWVAFIDRHGKPGRPDGARSRWRVSPTSELGPWRPCESGPGVLPAPPRASRPTPVSSGRPGCQEAAGAPPRASERPPLPGPRVPAREGDSCYDARSDRLPRLERISGRAAILKSPRRSANRRPIMTFGNLDGGGLVD